MGKEFWVGFMENESGSGSGSLDIFISAPVNTSGTVSMPLMGFNMPFSVTANTTTTVTVPSVSAMCMSSGLVENRAVLVQADDTVSVFAINFAQYTADAQVVYPLGALGTEYRIFSFYGLNGWNGLVSEFLVVAPKDGTEVEITTTANTADGHLSGVPYTVQLDSGQTYQVQAATAVGDFTGTTIIGTALSGTCRPFAVFSGTVCSYIPSGCEACDHICEQNLPRNAWGTTYYAVPFETTSGYTLRVLSDLDGTQISLNGGAPILLNAGQWQEWVDLAGPACITGNQRFGAAQYMQGVNCSLNGDPALLILNAEEQQILDVTFATVVSTVITDHYLNVITSAAGAGSFTLDGVPVPAVSFTPFMSCPQKRFAQLPLTQGSHRLQGVEGFTAYAYGMGEAESYAYSVGSFSPEPPILVDSVLCGLDSTGQITLQPPEPIFSPYWSLQSSPDDTLFFGSTYTFVPPGSDIYMVSGSEFLSQCPAHYYFSVEIDDPPTLTSTANGGATVSVCAYSPVQLGVTADPPGTYLYNWWPSIELSADAIPDPVATPSQTSWYYVSVSTLNGCAVALDSVLVTVTDGQVGVHTVSADPAMLCLGDSTRLSVDVQRIAAEDRMEGTLGSMWDSIAGGAIDAVCGSATGDALFFNGPTPRQAATNDLDVSDGGSLRFALMVADGVAPCDDAEPGDDIVLEYSTNGGGAWTAMATYFEFAYPVFTVVNAPIPPSAATASTRFRWRQQGVSSAGEDNWALDNIVISAVDTTGLAFQWSPAADIGQPTVSAPMAYPALTGWYGLTTTDASTGCTYSDSILITVGQPFDIIMTPDTALCDPGGVQLSAEPTSGTGHTWTWSPVSTLSSAFAMDPLAQPTATTMYHVTVTTAQGCIASDSVVVMLSTLQSLSVSTPDGEICIGEGTAITALLLGNGPGIVRSWSPTAGLSDPGISNPVASPLATTTYIHTVTDTVVGCVLQDSVTITVTDVYNAFAGPDTALCDALGLMLDVTHDVPAPFTISWTPSAFLSSAGSSNPTIQLDSTMTYVVQVSDADGCSAFDTVTVAVSFSELAIFSDTSLCAGQQAVIHAGFPAASHLWSDGSMADSIVVVDAGAYTVEMTDSLGCFVSHTTTVTVDALPLVTLGPDTSLCIGETWMLDAGNAGAQYLWSTTETTQLISTGTAGEFTVLVTDANLCSGTDTIVISFDPLPIVVLSDTAVCISESILLDAGNPGSYYAWSTGESTQVIAVDTVSGTYSVVVTTAQFCTDSANALIDFIAFPPVDLGPDTALCEGETLTMSVAGGMVSYLWSNGLLGPGTWTTQGGDLWVSVFNGYCTSHDTIGVVFNPLPAPALATDTACCLDYPPSRLDLDAGNAGCSFRWSTGDTTQRITVTTYGQYLVTITTPLGCSIEESALVREHCLSTLFVPNSFTPDDDDLNERFIPIGTNIATLRLRIFDRWGELIHEGMDADAGWDGKANGTPVQDGVYVWQVTYRSYDDAYGTLGAEQQRMGHVNVMR